MDRKVKLSGRIISAGRALVGVGQADFATVAGISIDALRVLEANGSAWIEADEWADAVQRALDHFGVAVIDEVDGMGAGVRLKFTREDVRQIVRLEGEGGIVASDDAP